MIKKLLLLTTLLSINAYALEENKVEMATKNATFINTNTGNGAGFMIKDTKLMITNKHVVNAKSKFINILTSDGKEFKGQYKWHSDKYDIALVEVFDDNDTIANNNTDIRFNGGLELCENSNNLSISEGVYGVGSPAGQRHVYREGYINSQKSFFQWAGYEVVQYQEYTGRGTSGSAILRKNGDCVLGVNFAGLLEYDIGVAVPVENLREVLLEYEYIKTLSVKKVVAYRLQEQVNKLNTISNKLSNQQNEVNKKILEINNKITNLQ